MHNYSNFLAKRLLDLGARFFININQQQAIYQFWIFPTCFCAYIADMASTLYSQSFPSSSDASLLPDPPQSQPSSESDDQTAFNEGATRRELSIDPIIMATSNSRCQTSALRGTGPHLSPFQYSRIRIYLQLGRDPQRIADQVGCSISTVLIAQHN